MRLQQQIEERILTAVHRFSASSGFGVSDMSDLLEATSGLSLSNLDNWERLVRQGMYLAAVNPKPIRWKFWERSTPFLTWIDLCSGDGFRRERTLRALSGAAPNSFFFAMAVRRLNDWVPQVRVAAREKLPLIAAASKPEHIVDVLCAVLPYWSSWGRMEVDDRQILLDIAAIEDVTQSLRSRLVHGTAGPLASVLSQAGRSSVLDTYLKEIAGNAIQPSVRAKAYKSLLDGKMVWLDGRKWEWIDIRYCKGHFMPIHVDRPLSVSISFAETLKAALVDQSSFVRRIAGDVLIRESTAIGPIAIQLANNLASDSDPSVAERGKFALKKLTQQASYT